MSLDSRINTCYHHRMPRPRKAQGTHLTSLASIHCLAEDLEKFRRAARRAGLSTSAWLLELARRAAELLLARPDVSEKS